jgi:RNA 2',3'-cyclic 3'-phosphodiesterase
VPEEQRRRLEPYLASCAAAAPEFRWTPAANLHLTVRFAGRLGEQRLPAFELALGRLGTFKRGRLVRVVWLEVGLGADQARALAAQVEAECVRAGLEPEARPFQPHLTLARARPRDGAALPSLPVAPNLAPWQADELVLYSSHLARTGAVYEPLRKLSLR